MLDNARIAHPAINFEQGQLAAVPVPDASLIGAICWYSIIYTPPELLNVAFSELRRTLVPGGYLLLAFQAGRSEDQHRPDAHGTGLPLTSRLICTIPMSWPLCSRALVFDSIRGLSAKLSSPTRPRPKRS